MAVPKTKVSHSRKNMRRSSVWKLSPPALSKCTQCGSLKVPHRICGDCGFYKGKQYINMDGDE